MPAHTRAGGGQALPGNPDNDIGIASGSGTNPAYLEPTVNERTEPTNNLPTTVQTTVGNPPAKPSAEHPRIDQVTGPMAEQAKEVGLSIVQRRRAEGRVKFRLGKLIETITEIRLQLEKSDNPSSTIVTNLIVRTTKDTNAIEEEFDSFNRHSGDTEIYLNKMLADEDHTQGRFNVAKYSPWINHLLEVNKYLFSVLDISIKTQLENLEEVKKSIQDKIDASSLPSSRSSSITR